jgi:hypothetical protein
MDAAEVRRRHQDALLSLPNVQGVGTTRDPGTGEEVIVAFVNRKVPRGQLHPRDVVPERLDGVTVRVEEVGEVTAQAP